jgi:uncharacterized protein
MRIRKLLITLSLLAFLLGTVAVWIVGSSLIAVTPHPVALGLKAEDIVLRAGPRQLVAGSYLAGRGRGAILLLHGIRGDRRQMVRRARWLHGLGYAVLLIDLPGQGASTADAVTLPQPARQKSCGLWTGLRT